MFIFYLVTEWKYWRYWREIFTLKTNLLELSIFERYLQMYLFCEPTIALHGKSNDITITPNKYNIYTHIEYKNKGEKKRCVRALEPVPHAQQFRRCSNQQFFQPKYKIDILLFLSICCQWESEMCTYKLYICTYLTSNVRFSQKCEKKWKIQKHETWNINANLHLLFYS